MKSIVVEEKYSHVCAFCGKYTHTTHHLIFGDFGSYRNMADEDGLTIPCCDDCHTMAAVRDKIHDNPMAEKLSKMLGQIAWEKKEIEDKQITGQEARENFRIRYKKSWL